VARCDLRHKARRTAYPWDREGPSARPAVPPLLAAGVLACFSVDALASRRRLPEFSACIFGDSERLRKSEPCVICFPFVESAPPAGRGEGGETVWDALQI